MASSARRPRNDGELASDSAIMSDNGSVVAFRSYATDLVEGDLNAVSDVFLFDVPETVVYKFSGFFAPVENLPAVNHVKAGQAVPVKFSLLGNQGLGIFAAGYPRSEQITCGSSISSPVPTAR